MAQFDVYPNPSPRSKLSMPYVVDVQSNLLSALPSRLVMPLSRVGIDAPMSRRLVKQFTVEGESFFLLAHAAAPVDARSLKDVVTSLHHVGYEVLEAMDVVLSGV